MDKRIIIEKFRANWQTATKYLSLRDMTSIDEVVITSINRAHKPSVQRGLKLGKGQSTTKPRQEVAEYLAEKIKAQLENNSITADKFDAWVAESCITIRSIYRKYGIEDYTLGNAQKLFNMTIKYILSSDIIDYNIKLFEVCHLPIDSVIMKQANSLLGVKPMNHSWSNTDVWDDILTYQKAIRVAIKNTATPYAIFWEIENWQKGIAKE